MSLIELVLKHHFGRCLAPKSLDIPIAISGLMIALNAKKRRAMRTNQISFAKSDPERKLSEQRICLDEC